jgi:hypothetical protein
MQLKKQIEAILDPKGETVLPPFLIHTQEGANIPCYTQYKQLLFDSTKHMALTDDPKPPRVSLVMTTTSPTTTLLAQADTQWMSAESFLDITPAQFAIAFGIYLNRLPKSYNMIGKKCNCAMLYTSEDQFIEHVLRCDQASPITHTRRHDMVRDAIVTNLRSMGITTTKEPTCFVYEDGSKKRPDILAHTAPMGLVTDVQLLHTDADLTDGEKEKCAKHAPAATKQHCMFIPFVMHTRGTLGNKAEQYINTVIKSIQPFQHHTAKHTMRHAVSIAAAKGRANAIMAAVDQGRW